MNHIEAAKKGGVYKFSSYLFNTDVDGKYVAIYRNDYGYLLVVERAQSDSLPGYNSLSVSFDACGGGIEYHIAGLFCDDENDIFNNSAQALTSVIDGLKR